MFRLYLFLFFVLVISNTNAQTPTQHSTKRHQFTINYDQVYYKNKQGVKTLLGTKDFLSANNTKGYQIGVGYEYVNKYNLIFSINAMYGIQTHEMVWRMTFEDYRPNSNFGGYQYTYSYQHTIPHLSSLFMIGYKLSPFKSKRLGLQLKGGLGFIQRLGWDIEEREHYIFYQTLQGQNYMGKFAYTDPESGYSGSWYHDRPPYYTVVFDANYDINTLLFKTVGVGVKYTSGIKINGGSFNATRSFYYNYLSERDGIQIYENLYRSLSLSFKVGF